MQIQLVPDKNGVKEWMALEVHGKITHDGVDFNNKLLGTLCWTDKNTVYLMIGNQLLEGKLCKFDRPVLVMEKDQGNGTKQLKVRAVVRNRILFKTRPSPLLLK
ncbi:unnamed protein product [Caenorhabditis auriculariae]|uniref:Chromosome transmission fidelity protein 8 n=1 Tax=Caenorhabditis auriculariae TaxID=2777116 RepID=A0A8S1GMZ1_9PELO|nr:unnamed protein product [Caenorhabditis auriculariae]